MSDIEAGSFSDQKLYLFYQVVQAVNDGMTIHTMAVGNHAETNLMRALATAGNGLFIHVPATSTAEEMRDTLEDKFSLLAGNVPAAKLLHDFGDEEEE